MYSKLLICHNVDHIHFLFSLCLPRGGARGGREGVLESILYTDVYMLIPFMDFLASYNRY